MTLAEQVKLPWDAFLAKSVEDIPEDRRARALELLVQHVEGFRKVEWPNIRSQVNQGKWFIPDDLEPHWVSPGKAVYWQEEIVRHREERDGRIVMVETPNGWKPTGALPANNAAQIVHYLSKGFRLRPPLEGVDQEILRGVEAALPAPEPQGEPEPDPYVCKRHRDRGFMRFPNWKAYQKHCEHFKEMPEQTPPAEVMERMAKYQYYCVMHDTPFVNQKHAERHLRTEMRKPGKPFHPTIADMTVKK